METEEEISIAERPYALNSVTSADGTRIGYRQIGHGPGIVVVQGAMGTAYNYDQLARAMAADFTVYLPDRRGRGMSPLEYRPGHSIRKEVEDLDGLLRETGAHFVFGLSSGAVIALEAARVLPSIRKAVLYEPPFYLQGISHDLIARFNREVVERDLAAALVTVNQIVKLAPAPLNLVPRPLLELATTILLRRDERKGAGKYASLRELIPSMRYDFKVVAEMDGKIQSFRAVKTEILLLGGARSPAYLKNALAALEQVLPNAQRNELPGLDHSGPWNSDRGGNPELVAQTLCGFFAE
jgi:pimeloyl-ACP methyl ester carboxylesterase